MALIMRSSAGRARRPPRALRRGAARGARVRLAGLAGGVAERRTAGVHGAPAGEAAAVDAFARRQRPAAAGHRRRDVSVLVARQPSRGVLLGRQAETGGRRRRAGDGAGRRLQREPWRVGPGRHDPVRAATERRDSRGGGRRRVSSRGHAARPCARRNGAPVSALPPRRPALPVRRRRPAAGRVRGIARRPRGQADLAHLHRDVVCRTRVPAVQQADAA